MINKFSIISIGLAYDNYQTNKPLGIINGSIGYYSDGKIIMKKQEIDLKLNHYK